MKIQSAVLCEVAIRQADKEQIKHNLLDGRNENELQHVTAMYILVSLVCY